jgi:hypothetical protein
MTTAVEECARETSELRELHRVTETWPQHAAREVRFADCAAPWLPTY